MPGHPTGLLQCKGESHRLRDRRQTDPQLGFVRPLPGPTWGNNPRSHGNPRFPSFLGVITSIYCGFKTFIFHGGPRVGYKLQPFITPVTNLFSAIYSIYNDRRGPLCVNITQVLFSSVLFFSGGGAWVWERFGLVTAWRRERWYFALGGLNVKIRAMNRRLQTLTGSLNALMCARMCSALVVMCPPSYPHAAFLSGLAGWKKGIFLWSISGYFKVETRY